MNTDFKKVDFNTFTDILILSTRYNSGNTLTLGSQIALNLMKIYQDDIDIYIREVFDENNKFKKHLIRLKHEKLIHIAYEFDTEDLISKNPWEEPYGKNIVDFLRKLDEI